MLVHGEALFTVAKNPKRPFVVRAAGVNVRAVGTAFNVKLAGPGVEVLVTEGAVRVERQSASAIYSNAETRPLGTEVSAGQLALVPILLAEASPIVTSRSNEEMDRLLVWRPVLLDFDSVPLSKVLEDFNRRNHVKIKIADHSLESLPIVASIRSDNVEGFVRLLEATAGIQAQRTFKDEIVLRRTH